MPPHFGFPPSSNNIKTTANPFSKEPIKDEAGNLVNPFNRRNASRNFADKSGFNKGTSAENGSNGFRNAASSQGGGGGQFFDKNRGNRQGGTFNKSDYNTPSAGATGKFGFQRSSGPTGKFSKPFDDTRNGGNQQRTRPANQRMSNGYEEQAQAKQPLNAGANPFRLRSTNGADAAPRTGSNSQFNSGFEPNMRNQQAPNANFNKKFGGAKLEAETNGNKAVNARGEAFQPFQNRGNYAAGNGNGAEAVVRGGKNFAANANGYQNHFMPKNTHANPNTSFNTNYKLPEDRAAGELAYNPNKHKLIDPQTSCFRNNDVNAFVAALEAEKHQTKHPLTVSWSWWYKKIDRELDWSEHLFEVFNFDVLEEFWCIYRYMNFPSELRWHADYSIFKSGISPMWEDAANIKGGRWMLRVPDDAGVDWDEIWMKVLTYVISGGSTHINDICGLVLNVRGKNKKVAIWTNEANNAGSIMGIGKEIKEALQIESLDMKYYKHDDCKEGLGKAEPKHTM